MKIFNLKALLLLIAFMAIALASCDETDDPVDPVETPEPPTNLQATSIDSSFTVGLKWDASPSETNALFQNYVITVDGVATPMTTTNTSFEITGLDEGTVYNFHVEAAYSNNEFSDKVSIMWSPASRFNMDFANEEIRLYGADVTGAGSGLQLYDSDMEGPQVRRITSKDLWDVGYDNSGGVSQFASGSLNTLGDGAGKATLLSEPIVANSLNELYDSEALSAKDLQERTIDLTMYNSNIVIVAKTTDNHYAKIFLEYNTNNQSFEFYDDIVEGNYIKAYISYQMVEDVPYAKPRP